jgi:hypothetical protein
MPKISIGRRTVEREMRQGWAPRQRPTALVELITTVALALSTVVAVTVVSIGIARADVVSAGAKSDYLAFAIALSIGLLFAAMSGITAIAAADPRRR